MASQVSMLTRVAALIPEAAPDVASFIETHDDSTELQSMFLSLIVDTSRAVAAQGSKNQRSSEHASLVSLVTRIHKDLKTKVTGIADQITGPLTAAIMADMDTKLGPILTSFFATQKDTINMNNKQLSDHVCNVSNSIKAELLRSLDSHQQATTTAVNEARKQLSDIASDVKAQQVALSDVRSHSASLMANMSSLVMAVSKAAEKIDMNKITQVIESAHTTSQAKLCQELVRLISDPLISELKSVRDDFNHIPTIMRDVDARITQMLTTLFSSNSDQLKQIPALTHSIMAEIMRHLSNQLTETRSDLATVTTGITSVETRLANAEIARAKKDTRKGSDAEDQLYDLLTERLKARDGFEVEQTNGHAASCDILVKKIGGPDIRIECKARGQGTGEKVRHAEVVKFQRDLAQTHSHGILVSLYSDIVGIGNFELQQLPTGKFAVYLSKLNFDVEPVIEMIHLLYKLDTLVTRSSSDDDADSDDEPVINVLATDMARVQQYLQNYALTVSGAKQHMRAAIRQLGELDFDKIAKMLLANSENDGVVEETDDTGAQPQPAGIMCELGCGTVCKTKSAMTRHKRNYCSLRDVNQEANAQ